MPPFVHQGPKARHAKPMLRVPNHLVPAPKGQGLEQYEVLSGTSDTRRAVTLSEDSDPSECPCGRSHARAGRARKRPGPQSHADMVSAVYDARASGKAVPGDRAGEWLVDYSGSCTNSHRIRRHSDSGQLMADYWVRCRRCPACLRARMGFWLHHAVGMTRATEEQGLRTWFGTLTLSPESQQATLAIARQQWMQDYGVSSQVPTWWDDPKCDYRFGLHRAVLVRELQLYFKRLRKAGHAFKYFVVFERHKSGWPHIHWLLHESQVAIKKDQLQEQWKHGFSHVKLVGGYDRKRKRTLSVFQ